MEKRTGPSNGNTKDSPNIDQGDGRRGPVPTIKAKAQKLWAKTGITWPLYKATFKGALPPTIAIAAYQATAWAQEFTTLGYLVGIMAILSLAIQPRAKFVQSMLLQLFLTCTAAAVALLAFYCCIQARISSEGNIGPGTGGRGTSGLAAKGAQTATYNAAASALAGVWLFVQVYFISVLRAFRPQYTIPCIMYAVFANVAMTYAPQFSAMAQAESFAKRLLEAYLTGFAIATGVSFFIFPKTSRQVVFDDINASIAGYRAALKANMTYMKSLENIDMFAAQPTNSEGVKPARSPEAAAFVGKIQGLAAMQGKLAMDLPFAKREIAIGKLGPDDLQELFRLLRNCMIPAVGLSCLSDIFARTAEERGWSRNKSFAGIEMSEAANEAERIRIQSINEWHELIRLLKEPFQRITDTIDQGFEHISLVLQLKKRPKQAAHVTDNESTGDRPQPGTREYAVAFRQSIEDIQASKELMLRGWCHLHGIELPPDFFSNPSVNFNAPAWMNTNNLDEDRRRLRRQLLVLLYVESLLYYMARRLNLIVEFADKLEQSGKLSHYRLVVPGYKRIRKWMYDSLFSRQDSHEDDLMDFNDQSTRVELGQAFRHKKDPEHLEPATTWEKFSDKIRLIPHFFGSPASQFGFRVAVAVMALFVVNMLRSTQIFYTHQRLFWAQIMISIGMSPSSGQSLRGFFLRIAGTFLAMVLALIAYYIVDGHVAGVLIFLLVTILLIIGYQLQVRKIGIAIATSNGQAYCEKMMNRLPELSGTFADSIVRRGQIQLGSSASFDWPRSVEDYFLHGFPYPITEHSQLRKNLGSSLYLVANYYSVVHETVTIRLSGQEGDLQSKSSPGRRLEKMRQKVFSKCQSLLAGLRSQSAFIKYDVPIGGKFPAKLYGDNISKLQNCLSYMALISIASTTFTELNAKRDQDAESEWLRSLSKIIGEAKMTSHSVTTLLSLMSASVSSGNPLPPYLAVPEPFSLTERLDRIDKGLLSVRHIAEPGYASFAVIQLSTKCLVEELAELLAGVKELVGELDFTYHIISTSDRSGMNSKDGLLSANARSDEQTRSKED